MTATVPPAPDEDLALFRMALFTQTPRVWVTPALVAANVALFAAMVATGVSLLSPTTDSLLKWGADYAPRTTAGEWWRLLSNTFVHVGAIHITMNMIGLWQIGGLVERLLGNRSFLLVYLFSGLCGSLASITWHPYAVAAGASGAVFGVYGVLIAYLVRHRGSIPRAVLSQLQRGTVFFIGLNIVLGVQQKGIDMAAHIGGLAGGFVGALLVARPLTGRHGRGDGKRQVMLLVIAVVMVLAAVRLIPRAVDLQSLLEDFQRLEQQTVDAYNGALQDGNDGKLTDAQLAKVIDDRVLPPWNQFRTRLKEVGRLPTSEADRMNKIDRYMDLRGRGWASLSEALRTGDDAKTTASKELQEQAEAAIKSATATTTAPPLPSDSSAPQP